MEDVKRKVLFDLFASPATLLPIVIGASSLMYSWAVGGDVVATSAGMMSLLGGVGFFASRMILGLEKMTQRAYDTIMQQRKQEQNESLDELERQLYEDYDVRTEVELRHLRDLHETFTESCEAGTFVRKHPQLVSQVEQIFHASVAQLRRSLELYELSQTLTGRAKQKILDEREQVIRDVVETRDHLSITIEQFQSYSTRRDQSELGQLRKELDETLRVAQKTEERMAEFGQPNKTYDESEFE